MKISAVYSKNNTNRINILLAKCENIRFKMAVHTVATAFKWLRANSSPPPSLPNVGMVHYLK
jgi:hypothetical protein